MVEQIFITEEDLKFDDTYKEFENHLNPYEWTQYHMEKRIIDSQHSKKLEEIFSKYNDIIAEKISQQQFNSSFTDFLNDENNDLKSIVSFYNLLINFGCLEKENKEKLDKLFQSLDKEFKVITYKYKYGSY